ncbi:acyl-CoA N-acyltransferase [Paraphaeosphaeria sporulosa]|uniref:Acyl-CoA N-acyltransferase n=1 Tax=Paraphaeosphaeria sporulosa TaxID=1460663 RepID=A0A177C6E3_9PLEO|nr:acyl-CoA N-acyltransferase [Paraphaeosphaeria sporulosa]OAG02701.1 acyl-CoA N-acyltransferase [Paraphaeosphaeria sporulosa]
MLAEVQASDKPADSPLPEPLFRTKRLLARPLHPQDAESSQRACAPASITRYMSLAFAHPYTLEHSIAWIAMQKDAPHNNLALTTHSDPLTVIGGIGIKPGADVQSHTGEVGYWISEEHQGKGLMKEALAGFVEWTFLHRTSDGSKVEEGRSRKTRLFAAVFAENTASMRILEGCGFVREGVQRGHVHTRYGEITDLHLFGLGRGEWEERRKQGE